MSTQDRFERLARQLGDRLQGASQAPADIQRNVQGVLRGAMERMEIVSREDFDIMMDVLTRTRERVEALEEQVSALENTIHSERAAQPTPSSASAQPTPPSASAQPTPPSASADAASSTPAQDDLDGSANGSKP